MYRNGFILLEAMVVSALVMLTWFFITHCAVQAFALRQQVEKKTQALVAACTAIEKLRSGQLLLQNQKITENGVPVIVSCESKRYEKLLYMVTVKVDDESPNQELVCLRTAILNN